MKHIGTQSMQKCTKERTKRGIFVRRTEFRLENKQNEVQEIKLDD